MAANPFLAFSVSNVTGFHDKQRIAEIISLTIAVFSIAIWAMRRGVTVITFSAPLVRYVRIFFFLGAVSSLRAYSLQHAFFEWSNFILLLALSTLVAHEVASKEGMLDTLLAIFGIGCVCYLFNEALLYVATLTAHAQPSTSELIFGFDNYRFFNHMQTVSLPMLGLLVLRSEREGVAQRLWFIVLSLWWALLFLSGGRGTFLGIGAGVFITLLIRHKEGWPWCRLMALSGAAGFAAYLLFYVLIPEYYGLHAFGVGQNVVGRTLEDPGSGRWALWAFALKLIVHHPLLGIGPMHFAHYGVVVKNAAHPHDWILQIACEWGVPALLSLIGVIYIAYRELIRAAQRVEGRDLAGQAAASAWLAIGAGILVDGLVSGLLVMPTSQLWIAVYVGCAWGWVTQRSLHAARAPSCGSEARSSMVVLLVIVLLLFWQGIIPEISNLRAFELKSIHAGFYPSHTIWPRMWRAGFF